MTEQLPPSETRATIAVSSAPVEGLPKIIETSEPRHRSPLAMATIVFTIVVAFAMVGLIHWRWATLSEPSSMVLVTADPAANGVHVELEQLDYRGQVTRTIETTLSAIDDFSARFFVRQGEYRFTAERKDAPTIHYEFSIGDDRALTLPIAGRFPSTAPAEPEESAAP